MNAVEVLTDVIMMISGGAIVFGILQKNYIAPLVAVGLLFLRYALMPLFKPKPAFHPMGGKMK